MVLSPLCVEISIFCTYIELGKDALNCSAVFLHTTIGSHFGKGETELLELGDKGETELTSIRTVGC